MLVKQLIPAPIVSASAPTSSNNVLSSLLPSFLTQSGITSKKNQLNTLLGTIQNPLSTVKDYAKSLVTPSNIIGSYINPGQSSIGGASIMGLFGKLTSTSGSGSSASTNTTSSGPGNVFSTVSSNLAGIRASLFSPIYGVLSSLTKLIKGVAGTISSVVSSFTTPVKNILRDIRNISNQATGIVNLVNSSIKGVTNTIRSVDSDLRATLSSLKKTAGVISHAPTTITQNLRDLVNAGSLPATRKFLQNKTNGGTSLSLSGSHTGNKLRLLNSGAKHTPESGAHL
jgi:hypothetical protein